MKAMNWMNGAVLATLVSLGAMLATAPQAYASRGEVSARTAGSVAALSSGEGADKGRLAGDGSTGQEGGSNRLSLDTQARGQEGGAGASVADRDSSGGEGGSSRLSRHEGGSETTSTTQHAELRL